MFGVAQAWAKVKEETIKKCFRKAGVLNHDTGCCVLWDVSWMEEDLWKFTKFLPENSCMR